jgi:thioredoxin-like negative regulator of GroEL
VGAEVAEATRENFRELVSEGVVLVDVWGASCQTCLALRPTVDRMAEERDDLKVIALEAPKARRLCIEMKVMSLPAFLLFKDGEEVSRLASPDLTEDALSEWVDQSLDRVRSN